MPKLIVVDLKGTETPVEGGADLSVMEVIRENGFDELVAICGGSCACATCHVYVEPAFAALLPPMGPDEDALLDSSAHRDPTSRLSCQIPFRDELDGLRVTIVPEG